MKIGIIGPKASIQNVQNVIDKNYLFIEAVYFEYEHYSEAVQIVSENEAFVDALLFTGTTPYQYVSNFIKPKVPWEYLRRNQISFLSALLKASYMNGWDISAVSIDSYDEKLIYDTYAEIGHSKEDIRVDIPTYSLLEENYLDLLLEFHREAYNAKKVHLCITGIDQIYDGLQASAIPCVKIQVSSEAIIDKINKLRLKYQMKLTDEGQAAVLAVMTDYIQEHSLYSKSDLQVFYKKNKVAEIIYIFAQRIGAAVIELSDGNYYLFTSKSMIENESYGFTKLDFLDTIHEKKLAKNIFIGIGIGHNTTMAKFNADLGRKKARQSNLDCMFIVFDDDKMIGPITTADKISNEPLVDNHIVEASKKTGIGINTLYKLDNLIRQYNIDCITPKELAKIFNVTPRSMNRILLKLEDAGYIKVMGKEQQADQGRPSRLIKIHL